MQHDPLLACLVLWRPTCRLAPQWSRVPG